MIQPMKVLLQTTITYTQDDWHIGRFSMLRDYLAGLRDPDGFPILEVIARDRENDARGNDRVLSGLAESDFDALWLFAVDTGNGLSEQDVAGINAFRNRGGGVLTARDHQDLGSCLCLLDEVGQAHYFHSHHNDPNQSNCCADDNLTRSISWPNYHSGNNGDFQEIEIVKPTHSLLINEHGHRLRYFPAHPHEGSVGVPLNNPYARVIARGKSVVTGHSFNLVAAFEPHDGKGPALAESSFHHFCDYNWDVRAGCPSFVAEKPADGYQRYPEALDDIKSYAHNVALWLAGHRVPTKAEIQESSSVYRY